MDLNKTIQNLEARGFKVSHFENAQEAAAWIAGQVSGKSVGIGGSKTVEALGLFEKLSEDNTVYWHWKTPGRETLKSAALTDVYLVATASGVDNYRRLDYYMPQEGKGVGPYIMAYAEMLKR